jgi:hypothetical protein
LTIAGSPAIIHYVGREKEANMKVQYVLTALKAGKNKFTVSQLTDVIRADAGDKALERRTRRALFVARKAGIMLEPVRDGGKAVVAYQLQGSVPETATVVTTARKAAKAASPKVATKAKAASPKVATVKLSTVVKKVSKNFVAAKAKAVKTKTEVKVDEAIVAKNLATIKAVHAKVKQNVAKHPITGRDMTDEQIDALEEFRALESGWETEEQERNAARAAVRENLPKEFYAE